MQLDREVSEKHEFPPKLGRLQLFFEKNTKKFERETQENLKRQREAEKELVSVRFLKWAIAKSGQENLLFSQKYGFEEETQKSLDIDKVEKVIQKFLSVLNTVASRYPGEENALKKLLEEKRKRTEIEKTRERQYASIANGEVISHADYENLKKINVRKADLLEKRDQASKILNDQDEMKNEVLLELLEIYRKTKDVESDPVVPVPLKLEMPEIREGIKQIGNKNLDVLDAALLRIKPLVDPILAEFTAFEALKKNHALLDDLLDQYEKGTTFQKSEILLSMLITDQQTGSVQFSSEFKDIGDDLKKVFNMNQ